MRKRFLLTFLALVGFILSASAYDAIFPHGSGPYTVKVNKTISLGQPKYYLGPVEKTPESNNFWSENASIASVVKTTGVVTGKAVGEVKINYQGLNGNSLACEGSITVVVIKGDGKLTAPKAKDLTYEAGAYQELVTAGNANGTGTVWYKLEGGTWSTDIPKAKNASDYKVYYKLVGDDNHTDVAEESLTVTIKPKVLGSESIKLLSDYTFYNGEEKRWLNGVVDGNYSVPMNEYTVTYSNNVEPGVATITITDREGGNYIVNGEKTFTIYPDVYEVNLSQTSFTYNGEAREPAVSSVTYGPETVDPSKYTVSYSDNVNVGTATVTVTIRIGGGQNQQDPIERTSTAQFYITQKIVREGNLAIELGDVPAGGYTYDGTAKEPPVTVKDGDTVILPSEYTVTYKNNTNAGTAEVIVTDKDGGNYDGISGTTTFTINAAAGSLTAPTTKSLTYDGSAQELVNAGSSTTGTVEYSADGSSWSSTIPTGTDAGSYTVWYRVKGDAGHEDVAAASLTVTIAPKSVGADSGIVIEATVPTGGFTYDGTAKEPAVTVKDATGATIPASEYTVSYSNNTNPGTATITISNVPGNYDVSGTTTFTINAVGGSLTAPTAKSLTYNGSAQELMNAGSSTTGTVEYSLDGNSYSTSIPTGTDAYGTV